MLMDWSKGVLSNKFFAESPKWMMQKTRASYRFAGKPGRRPISSLGAFVKSIVSQALALTV